MDQHLEEVLTATGFMIDGGAAPGTKFAEGDQRLALPGFEPDATWTSRAGTRVYFKRTDDPENLYLIAGWRQRIWNQGFAPLLWVVAPERIDLYDCFAKPRQDADPRHHPSDPFIASRPNLRH
jgi:hypothetical protein